MSDTHGFEKIKEQEIPELNTRAELFRHRKTGAELLSLINDDENKVFGITFRTPPRDSTGVPHILEHSVLCGSRKYPVKEPFVELLKGSLQTFLNAMTYPDKTCYPVASQNVKDFYNLVDVYLDAVFYPRISPTIFKQEGWHYELEDKGKPLIYKGVVFNEMKGAYSSPDNLLYDYSFQSLFPDNAYSHDSGGDPKEIPKLTYEQFRDFHRQYYHPSNSRIYFYGDDDPGERLRIAEEYLQDFDRLEVDSEIKLQAYFDQPRRFIRAFAAGEGEAGTKGMMTLNWLLHESTDEVTDLALSVLEYILLGMTGSPLRKALIESGLGEDLAGAGLGSESRQIYFSTGLKGIDLDNVDRIQNLIMQTLTNLTIKGIDPNTVEAALNRIEFTLRENNTGSYPRGLLLMLRALTTWLYGGDPLALVAFEDPLAKAKAEYTRDRRYFEALIERFFLNNSHRTTVILRPEPDLAVREREAEKKILEQARAGMDEGRIEDIVGQSRELKKIQETPDPPEALASIPLLSLDDLEKKNKTIPIDITGEQATPLFFHDLFTNGIVYLDLALDLHGLPQKQIPYTRLLGRALLEMGTETEDYVRLSQRINRKTGGIGPAYFTSMVKGGDGGETRLILRAKAMASQVRDMLDILRDILLTVKLDNRARFRQILLEAKAREEQKLVPSGHQVVSLRLKAHFSEADWFSEQISGLSYLFFLRDLVKRIDSDWPAVLGDLEETRRILVNRRSMILNLTCDEKTRASLGPAAGEFIGAMPADPPDRVEWVPGELPLFEGLTIPAQVNYVGKGLNLYETGYRFHGSINVITRFLRNAYLWDRVRVQGGAYGAFCNFDRLSGSLTLVSYRDPNLLRTLDVFDQAARFLRELELHEDELTKAIIGAIGTLDQYRLPDAKGYTSLARHLTRVSDEDRQQVRDEILGTTQKDFKALAEVLENIHNKGIVKVLGAETAIREVEQERPSWLKVLKVL